MISDAKKISLDKVTKTFFSCRKIFSLQQEYFSYCKKKKSWGKKKIVVTLYKGIFLASDKKK